MLNHSLSRAIDFIKANQNPDGGWGYYPQRESLTEPTAFCLLSLYSSGENRHVSSGLSFLKSCQSDSGAVGIDKCDQEGNWMAYAALLAFHMFEAEAEKNRLIDWALDFQDASSRLSKEYIKAIRRKLRFDPSIRGWPWTTRTTAWVEPTSLFIIALTRSGIPKDHDRIRSGVKLLLDRKIKNGGWNFGNPYDNARYLEPGALPTSLAVLALHLAGHPGSGSAVRQGLQILSRSLENDMSVASLIWALLALKALTPDSLDAGRAAARLMDRQASDGSFRGNLFETSLAYLALGDSSPILGNPGAKI